MQRVAVPSAASPKNRLQKIQVRVVFLSCCSFCAPDVALPRPFALIYPLLVCIYLQMISVAGDWSCLLPSVPVIAQIRERVVWRVGCCKRIKSCKRERGRHMVLHESLPLPPASFYSSLPPRTPRPYPFSFPPIFLLLFLHFCVKRHRDPPPARPGKHPSLLLALVVT